MKKEFISVVIPLKELSYYLLFETLPALAKQTYKNFEVIILPNANTHYDLTLLKRYKWIKIVSTGKITRPAEKRNIGAKSAKGEIIAFLDDDAYPSKKWLEIAVRSFDKNIFAVCGPGALPKFASFWEKSFDQMLTSRFGSAAYSYRFTKRPKRFVDDYPSMNFLIQKKIFLKLGGFKGDYWPGEDSKLCRDIVYKEKGLILYNPEILVYHHRRKELKGHLIQHGNYGYHRGAFAAHGDENSRRFSYLIPTLFFVYLVVLFFSSMYLLLTGKPLTSSFSFVLATPLFLYMLTQAFVFLRTFFTTGNVILAASVPMVLSLTHFVYAIQFIHGFVIGAVKKEKIYG